MIREGAKLFDELVVAIGINPDKQYSFSLSDRLGLLRECIGDQKGVRIESFENKFLVRYASEIGSNFILRGIRTESDYDYERGMRHVNADLQPEIASVFLMPPREIAEVSSSFVKGLIGPEGWQEIVMKYVPGPVFRVLKQQFGELG